VTLDSFLQGQKTSRAILTYSVFNSTDDQRRLFFYKPFLPIFDPETPSTSPSMPSHLFNTFSKSTRILTSFRCSGHSLRIETGQIREGIKDRKARTCLVCKSPDSIEDEKHFLLSCPSLAHIRDSPEFSTLPFDKSVHHILSPAHFPLNAIFLQKMSQTREEILSQI
jgi:hypothetical protein